MNEKELRKACFVRICEDSGFTLEATKVAQMAAQVLKCSPHEIWIAFGTLKKMEEAAKRPTFTQ